MPAPSNRWEQFLQAKGLPFDTTPTAELQKEYQANPSGTHWAPVSNYTQDDGTGAMPQTYVTYQNLETGETTTEKPTAGTILKELGYADIDGGRMVYQDPNTGAFYKDGQKWNATPAEVSRALTNTAESQAEFNKQHSNQEDFLGKYAPAIILGGAAALAAGGGAALAASEGAASTASATAAMPSFGDLLGTAVSNIPKNMAISAGGQLLTTGTIDPKKLLIGAAVGAVGGVAGQYAGAAAGGGLIGSVIGGGVSGGVQSALLGNKDMLASIVASGIASGAGSLTQDWLNANAQALSDATGISKVDVKNTIQGALRAGLNAVFQGKDEKTALAETLLGAGMGYVSSDIEKAWKSATGTKPDPLAEASPGQGLIQMASADSRTAQDVQEEHPDALQVDMNGAPIYTPGVGLAHRPGYEYSIGSDGRETEWRRAGNETYATRISAEPVPTVEGADSNDTTAKETTGNPGSPEAVLAANAPADILRDAGQYKPSFGDALGIPIDPNPGGRMVGPQQTTAPITGSSAGTSPKPNPSQPAGSSGAAEQPAPTAAPAVSTPPAATPSAPAPTQGGPGSSRGYRDTTGKEWGTPAEAAAANFTIDTMLGGAGPGQGGIIGAQLGPRFKDLQGKEWATPGEAEESNKRIDAGFGGPGPGASWPGPTGPAQGPGTIPGLGEVGPGAGLPGPGDPPLTQPEAPRPPPIETTEPPPEDPETDDPEPPKALPIAPVTPSPVFVAPVIVSSKPKVDRPAPPAPPPPTVTREKMLSFADISLSYNPVQRPYIDWAAPRT